MESATCWKLSCKILTRTKGIYLCRRYTSPIKLTAHFLIQQTTPKFHQSTQYSRLKEHSANRCGGFHSKDRKMIASSTRSNERRLAPESSVNFKEETYTNGDLRNEDQKTRSERLKPQAEDGNHKPRIKVICRYMRRRSTSILNMDSTLLRSKCSS
jgi:hypothetical protein